jgi:hypothetical protein
MRELRKPSAAILSPTVMAHGLWVERGIIWPMPAN